MASYFRLPSIEACDCLFFNTVLSWCHICVKQVQVAQVMGQPTPEPPKNTGTPPLILRMPISSDERAKPEEKLTLKNVSTIVSVVSTERLIVNMFE